MNMKNTRRNNLLKSLGSLLYFSILLHPTSIKAQEVEDEREFDYKIGSGMGPDQWGTLNSNWSTCSNGTMQSPIDMSSRRVALVPASRRLQRNYKPASAIVINRGHDIMLQWESDAGYIRINNTDYALQQAHWHSPSEHTINGRRYAMELHLVHLSQDLTLKDKIAVIAVLFKIGKPDSFLSKLAVNISSIVNQQDEHRHPGVIDPREIQMSTRRYYRYIGSLTTPPCTEGVIWTISRKIRTVSKDQIALLRDAVHDYAENNARPLQAENCRDINLYEPEKSH